MLTFTQPLASVLLFTCTVRFIYLAPTVLSSSMEHPYCFYVWLYVTSLQHLASLPSSSPSQVRP